MNPSTASAGPPSDLVRSLLGGPSAIRGFDWHPTVASTNELAAEAAFAGAPEIHVVAADVQTAGRGRLGRRWVAPPGTSLQCSWLLRPPNTLRLGLLPLTVGVALAQTVAAHCPGAAVALKWPNDVQLNDRKCAGVLVEHVAPGVVVVGTGVNIDWRGVERTPDLEGATSLSETVGAPVDRWRFFAGLAGVLSRRYEQLVEAPEALLGDYRRMCATIGRPVRVSVVAGDDLEGRAVDVDEEGALILQLADGSRATMHAGDVEHLRPR